MALTPADIGLAEAVVTVSVTFWAVYMALYVFVFAHFQSADISHRLIGGADYYAFFREGSALSVLSFSVVVLAIVSLVIEQELPLAAAVSVFFSEFIAGTILIIQQTRRVGEITAMPYAATEWVLRKSLEQHPNWKQISRRDKKRVIRILLPSVGPDILKVTEKVIAEVESGVKEMPKWWQRKKRPAPALGEKPKDPDQGGSSPKP